MKFDLAIEMGSGTTSMYRRGYGFVLREPTLVAAVLSNSLGYSVKAVGVEAKKMLGKTADTVAVFSPIINGVVVSFEYAKYMLKTFLKKIGLDKKNINALLVLPSGMKSEDKDKYKNVCYGAGIKQVKLIPSVIAAAIGAGFDVGSTDAKFVVNMGSGITDIAVLNLNTIIKGGSVGIGGKMMDSAIVNLVADSYGVQIGIPTAERIKNEIGSIYEKDGASMEITGVDLGTKQPKNIIVTASDVKSAVLPFLEEIGKALELTLNLTPPDVLADIMRNGIMLTGRVSKLPGIDKYFGKLLKIPVIVGEDSDMCVIIGAGKLIGDDHYLDRILMEEYL